MCFAQLSNHRALAALHRRHVDTQGFSLKAEFGANFTPLNFDVTDEPAVLAAAREVRAVLNGEKLAGLVNNAGIAVTGPALSLSVDEFRRQMDVIVIGPIIVTQAFAPVLAKAGESAVINVLSSVTWLPVPFLTAYSASKAAAWSFTNNVRVALKEQNPSVVGLHVHFVDTDLTKGVDIPKANPNDVAGVTFEGLEAGKSEVFADDTARAAKRSLSSDVPLYIDPNQAS